MKADISEMIDYVRREINSGSRESAFKFRDRFKHTLRVLKWAERIWEFEGGDLEVIKIASIFHDAGWDDEIHHAIVSRNIASDYLNNIDIDERKKEKILEAIKNHSFRDGEKPLNLESYIVMDADILDEVGALSILWDAMAEGYEKKSSYRSAYERISRYTKELIERKIELKTNAGRRFYEERLEVLENYLNELAFELEEFQTLKI